MQGISYTKDEMLKMIANTLVVYGYHISDNGMLDGKAGALLFLFRYAARCGTKRYEEFACELLDGLMKTTMSLPPDFENGLAGVGWTISRLLNERLVQGNPNEVMRNIDEMVIGRSDNDRQKILGQAVYMADRLEASDEKYDLLRHTTGMMEYMIRELSHSKTCPSLYHLNSALHFFVKTRHMPDTENLRKRLFGILPALYERIGKEGTAGKTDMRINEMLVRQIGAPSITIGRHHEKKHYTTASRRETPHTTVKFLHSAWQEILYFGRPISVMPSQIELSQFIDNCQKNIRNRDLCVREGMTGLGLALLHNC